MLWFTWWRIWMSWRFLIWLMVSLFRAIVLAMLRHIHNLRFRKCWRIWLGSQRWCTVKASALRVMKCLFAICSTNGGTPNCTFGATMRYLPFEFELRVSNLNYYSMHAFQICITFPLISQLNFLLYKMLISCAIISKISYYMKYVESCAI